MHIEHGTIAAQRYIDTARADTILADIATNGPALESTIAQRTGIPLARVIKLINKMLYVEWLHLDDHGHPAIPTQTEDIQ